jgi:multiple sugar transport system substrate-binding protein
VKVQVQRHRRAGALVAIAASVALAAGCGSGGDGGKGSSGGGTSVFLSSQGSELTEAQALRSDVLAGSPESVKFVPVKDDPYVIDRITAESKSGKGTTDLIGALHGGFVSMEPDDLLLDVSDVAADLAGAGIPRPLMDLGKLGTDTQHYIPWMQGTYVMVANKKALPYLPAGADVNRLTYAQLLEWARNIKERTGQAKLGLPASVGNGLIKRFLEGYVIPAYSGGVVTTFKSPASVQGWQYLKQLWQYANPQSSSYDAMSDPLRSQEVWIAWDHVAVLRDALEAQPDDFVVFPAPSGPRGRAYMPVVAGLGIPKTAPHPEQAKQLIKYLLSAGVQDKTLSAIGFFPVVKSNGGGDVSPGLQLESEAVAAQQDAPDALQSLLPIGLGDDSDDFDKVFTDTFTRIVLKGEDVTAVLDDEAGVLQGIIDRTGAPCWAPDPASNGPCQVK